MNITVLTAHQTFASNAFLGVLTILLIVGIVYGFRHELHDAGRYLFTTDDPFESEDES